MYDVETIPLTDRECPDRNHGARCANPYCRSHVPVRGEFCRGCADQQRRTADELRGMRRART